MRAVHLNDQISFNMNTTVAIHVDPMIRAEVLVYAYVYGDQKTGFKLDTMDTEITWFLNGKRTKPQGCPNGKQIDMTTYILRQMAGEISRFDVEEKINYYQKTNL